MVDNKINFQGIQTTPLQWLQSDLIVNASTGLLVVDPSASPVSAKYVPPEPVPGKPHYFISILYRQPPTFSVPSCLTSVLAETLPARLGFNLLEFTQVVGLGTPVAANWFQAQNPTPLPTPYPITASLTSHYHVPCVSTPTPTPTPSPSPSSTPTPA